MILFTYALILITMGWLLGIVWTDWDNRCWARRHGWCPECGRDTVQILAEDVRRGRFA